MADLFVDGLLLGKTPFKQRVRPGVIELRAESKNMKGKRSIQVAPGADTTIELDLEAAKGFRPHRLLFIGAATAAVGAGVLMALAQTQLAEARDTQAGEERNLTESQRSSIDTLWGVGISSAATAGALLGTGLLFELIQRGEDKNMSGPAIMDASSSGILVGAETAF